LFLGLSGASSASLPEPGNLQELKRPEQAQNRAFEVIAAGAGNPIHASKSKIGLDGRGLMECIGA
jgi:hypothetical protein